MDKNKKRSPFAKYWLGVALAFDQLGAAFRGWDHDETISSVLGKMETRESSGVKKMRPIPRLLSRFLNRIDDNHCRDAIEKDEGKNAVFDNFDHEGVGGGY